MKNLLRQILRVLPDKLYIQLQYFYHFHKFANLKKPKTFNEKLNWLKLYDRNPLYTIMVDKYKVKDYIANIIGKEYIIPTLGVYNNADEIDFDKLPNQFVLKCVHDSKSVIICKNKDNFDKKGAIVKLSKSLKKDFYWYGREWPYRNVPRKIIAEQYIEDNKTKELRDYKFFCFNGYVDNVMVCVDRKINDPKFYFFNNKWELLRINKRGLTSPKNFTVEKPILIDEMFEVASILSRNIPFVRVDLYNCNNRIFFGEMTFYPASGFDSNLLPETDKYLGDLIKLSK